MENVNKIEPKESIQDCIELILKEIKDFDGLNETQLREHLELFLSHEGVEFEIKDSRILVLTTEELSDYDEDACLDEEDIKVRKEVYRHSLNAIFPYLKLKKGGKLGGLISQLILNQEGIIELDLYPKLKKIIDAVIREELCVTIPALKAEIDKRNGNGFLSEEMGAVKVCRYNKYYYIKIGTLKLEIPVEEDISRNVLGEVDPARALMGEIMQKERRTLSGWKEELGIE